MIDEVVFLITSNIEPVLNVAFSIVALASTIAALTKTPSDDEWIGKIYKVIDVLALNVGYAKDKPKKITGGRFVAD